MNALSANHYVFKYLLNESFTCPGVEYSSTGQTCKHGLAEAHDVTVPDLTQNIFLVYKAEQAFLALAGNPKIKIYKARPDVFVVSITTDVPSAQGLGSEKTLLKAKIEAFASYIRAIEIPIKI